MERIVHDRTYWAFWWLAAAMTGVAAGMMVGHALLLGPYLSWMLASGKGKQLSETYPVFALSGGRFGLSLYYIVLGLQTLAGLAFFAVSIVGRHKLLLATIAALASPLWQTVHYVSGFSALEISVLRSVSEVSQEAAVRFVAWNAPIHAFYAATLLVALCSLLLLPIRTSTRSSSSTEL